MTRLRLHLDADTSRISLLHALHERDIDVTRTPNDWMPLDATDLQQLLGASAQGRCIFTFNARDFIPLASRYPNHNGIIISTQRPMYELLQGLSRICDTTLQEDWLGQVRWLNDWLR